MHEGLKEAEVKVVEMKKGWERSKGGKEMNEKPVEPTLFTV